MRTLNRAFLAAGAALCALGPTLAKAEAPSAPTLTAPLAIEDIRHALTRTSFGASPEDLRAFVGQPRAALIESILDDLSVPDTQPRPAFASEGRYPLDLLFAKSETLAELAIGQQYINLAELSAWWMVEMMNTEGPFKEQIALFWMDHFVTSFVVHEDSQHTAAKFQSIRDHLGGSFEDLLSAQLRDPAMLIYLNNTENTAEAPNENLGRELLELFTLGQGRGYTEADIRDVSRALTGATLDADGAYAFLVDEHDGGRKTIFGQAGAFGPDDLPGLILSQEAFGPYIVERLWHYLVSAEPDPAEVQAITAQWRASDWDLPSLYRGILETPGFWQAAHHGALVKSPLELYIGFARTFGTPPPYVLDVYDLSLDGGQEPFMPPNVAGWDEGPAWITDATLAQRTAALQQMGEIWAYEDYQDLVDDRAVEAAPGETEDRAETQGLRVGLSVLDWAWIDTDDDDDDEDTEDGGATAGGETASGYSIGASLRLFDLGFRGQTYANLGLSFGYEVWDGEAEPYLSLDPSLCPADCPLRAVLDRVKPETDPDGTLYHEFWMSPWEMSEGVGRLRSEEKALLGAIVKALPALIADTRDDQTWTDMAQEAAEEGLDQALRIPSFGEVSQTTERLSAAFSRQGSLRQAIKAAPALERGLSDPARRGIPPALLSQVNKGAFDATDEAAIDALYNDLADQQTAPYQQRLVETHADPEHWFSALPAQARTRAGLEIALLPVRNPALATDDKAVQGLEDLLFSLILDPRFQLK